MRQLTPSFYPDFIFAVVALCVHTIVPKNAFTKHWGKIISCKHVAPYVVEFSSIHQNSIKKGTGIEVGKCFAAVREYAVFYWQLKGRFWDKPYHSSCCHSMATSEIQDPGEKNLDTSIAFINTAEKGGTYNHHRRKGVMLWVGKKSK